MFIGLFVLVCIEMVRANFIRATSSDLRWLDCLVLVRFDLHTLVDVHWFVCFGVYSVGEVYFLSTFCDKFLFS